jgi:hypothetical protein
MPLGKGCFAFCGIVDILNRIETCVIQSFFSGVFSISYVSRPFGKPAHRTGGRCTGQWTK